MVKGSDMTGRAALVTGAAGGVGRETALELARMGADVMILDRDENGLNETATLARAANAGPRIEKHVADLAERASCPAAVEVAVSAFGRLDALCNVAGVFLPARTEHMPVEQWELTMAVNLSAPFYLIQAAIPHLLKADGAVVNVTSCAGTGAQAYSAAYCATKAGLDHMTRSLAIEFIDRPIRINAVAPGGMLTSLTRNVKFPEDMDRELFQRCAPLRSFVDPADVAQMVAFLCSEAARGYHGAVIAIDNGITAG